MSHQVFTVPILSRARPWLLTLVGRTNIFHTLYVLISHKTNFLQNFFYRHTLKTGNRELGWHQYKSTINLRVVNTFLTWPNSLIADTNIITLVHETSASYKTGLSKQKITQFPVLFLDYFSVSNCFSAKKALIFHFVEILV